MSSTTGFENAIMLTNPLPIAITVPEPPLPIDREARKSNHEFIEDRFEAAMQRRRDFIEQFERDTGLELDATRRDSVAEAQHPASLAKANHGAIKLLLEAWYERIGIQDAGWTRYNEKTTPRACRTIREILEKGDEELGIPIEALEDKEEWTTRLNGLKWWFFSYSTALDFLSAYGLGPNRFGSGTVRVEMLNYSSSNGKCTLGLDHVLALQASREGDVKIFPNRFPPRHLCGCYDYKLFIKKIGNSRKLPVVGDERLQKVVSDKITRDWMALNEEAEIGSKGWPKSAEDQVPLEVVMEGEPFLLWFFKGDDDGKGVAVRVCRIEGRVAELL